MPKCFNRLFKLKRQVQFFTFDVETWGLNATEEGFALGCIYGPNYQFQTDDIEKLRKELLSEKFNNCIMFAHNAIYDLSTIFGNVIADLDPNTVMNNSTFILSKVGKITFADSMNILPTKLENIGTLLGYPKGKTPLKFIKGKPTKLTKRDFDYCMQDCKVLHKALSNLFEEIGCVRVTLAGLSMAYFRRKYLKEALFYDDLVYDFFDSYFGGRVECFKLGKVYAQKFDINSMYPHAMKIAKFPHPNKLRRDEYADIKKLKYCLEYYEGMADITVHHKYHYFGFLPLKHNKKLIFPNGTFRGKWNFPEIRLALKHKVIEIKDVHSVTYAPPMESIFSEFVDDLFNKRLNSRTEFERYLYKIILNSLYGKFAQRKKFKTEYVEDVVGADIGENTKIVPFSNERSDAYLVTEQDYYSYNTIPVFSSYITSLARVNLLSKMVKYIDNDIVYVDTDSIAVNNYTVDIETSSALGEFKVEDKIITEIIGNKSYREKGGTIVMKGVKKGSKEISEGTFIYKRMIKPKTALRRNMKAGSFITETKTIKAKYDKRKVFSDGTTQPLEINDTNHKSGR